MYGSFLPVPSPGLAGDTEYHELFQKHYANNQLDWSASEVEPSTQTYQDFANDEPQDFWFQFPNLEDTDDYAFTTTGESANFVPTPGLAKVALPGQATLDDICMAESSE